jgi:hypothetical protein
MTHLTASPPSLRMHAAFDRLKRPERAAMGGAGKYTGARPSAAFMATLDAQAGYPDWQEEHDWTQEDNPAPFAGGRWEEDE